MCECGSHRSIVLSVFFLTLLYLSPMFYFAFQIGSEEGRRQEEHLCHASDSVMDLDLRDSVLEDHFSYFLRYYDYN